MIVKLTEEELKIAIDDYLQKIMPHRYSLESELDLYVVTNNIASGGDGKDEQAIDEIAVYNVDLK